MHFFNQPTQTMEEQSKKKRPWKPDRSKYDVELEPWEQKIAEAIYAGKPLLGEGGAFTDMIKGVVQASLKGEMHAHLKAPEQEGNRRNGYTPKQLKTSGGQVEIATPRDRDGSFEPRIVEKRQRVLNAELDRKILSMYGLGLSYADIAAHMREIYGVETNDALINAVTDTVIEDLRAWQGRALEPIYAIVWLDAAFFNPGVSSGASTRARCAAVRCTPCWGWTSMATRTCWACTWRRARARGTGWACSTT